MSKKNPAFLFYFGDAARDVSSLNRLERGCYFDLIQAHWKYDRFTMEQIRKVLGKDFKACWGSLELILDKDEEGYYYIEWALDSINKSRKKSIKQTENIKKRWDKEKEVINNDLLTKSTNFSITNVIPNEYHGTTNVVPLETETEYINTIVDNNPSSKINKVNSLNNLREENEKSAYDFCMQKIYEKKWEEYQMCLNGQAKFLNEEIFDRWKQFVELVTEKFTTLLSTKFISPIDFGKLIRDEKFTEEKWEEVLKLILSSGAKPEHELFFRIPVFMGYVERNKKIKSNGNNQQKLGTSEGQIRAARKFATGEY